MKKEQVIKKIVGYIKDQALHKGEKLPPERELSSILAISRSTIREALRVLEERGVLMIKRGSGVYINRRPDSFEFEIDESIDNSDDKTQIKNWLELSLLVIPTIVYRAAERISSGDIHSLVNDIIAMSRCVISRNLEQLAESGNEFFIHLASITGNRKYIRIIKEINTDYDLLWQFFIEDEEFLNNVIFSGFVEMVNSIKERKPEQAYNIARQNLINIGLWFDHNRGYHLSEELSFPVSYHWASGNQNVETSSKENNI